MWVWELYHTNITLESSVSKYQYTNLSFCLGALGWERRELRELRELRVVGWGE